MVELSHVLVGAAIATKIGNPALSLPLAFASHFVLDLVPHWNPPIYKQIKEKGRVETGTKRLLFIDSLTALVVGFLIAASNLPNTGQAGVVLLAAFLAVLPDLVEIPYYFLGSKNQLLVQYIEINHSFQTAAPLLLGILTQILVSLAALWWMVT